MHTLTILFEIERIFSSHTESEYNFANFDRLRCEANVSEQVKSRPNLPLKLQYKQLITFAPNFILKFVPIKGKQKEKKKSIYIKKRFKCKNE